jgi:hypothetical protein
MCQEKSDFEKRQDSASMGIAIFFGGLVLIFVLYCITMSLINPNYTWENRMQQLKQERMIQDNITAFCKDGVLKRGFMTYSECNLDPECRANPMLNKHYCDGKPYQCDNSGCKWI